ncbi:hypothetical protein FGM04_03255 [Aeromonas veronii]|nr:hypothetical protein FGM04_03255 [Aeromonas veronii]
MVLNANKVNEASCLSREIAGLCNQATCFSGFSLRLAAGASSSFVPA